MGVRPSFPAAAAVSMAWLDWAPPVVNTTSAPLAMASASRNSSLRVLFPPRPRPVRSSRLTKTLVCSRRLIFSSRQMGVGNTPRDTRSKASSDFMDLDSLSPCAHGLFSGAIVAYPRPGIKHKKPGRR